MPQRKNPLGKSKSSIMPDELVRNVQLTRRRFTLMESNYLLDSEEPFGLTVFADPLLKGISLTNLTEEELDALERFWVTAFEMARPIVQLYDKQAADALADGSRKFWRMYRPPPIEYIRNEKPAIQKPKPDPEREE